eukprot:COSAG01_NODE_717_length_14076_cov_20.354225_4_plen_60_part_00
MPRLVSSSNRGWENAPGMQCFRSWRSSRPWADEVSAQHVPNMLNQVGGMHGGASSIIAR